MTVTIRLDTKSLDDVLRQLEDDVTEAVRPAAQAAAQVLYNAVKTNVGALGRKTGNLDRSIYQVYSKTKSNAEVASYEIGWNRRIAPHGQLVEFGHIQKYAAVYTKEGKWITLKNRPLATPKQVAARPFIRPAQSRFPQALEAARAELLKRIK